jgi:uncharacterized membrane protein YccC
MRVVFLAIVAALLVALAPSDGHAYIGPGAGLSAFGALLALVVTVIVAIFGFVWYPIKRLTRSLKRRRAQRAVPDNLAT